MFAVSKSFVTQSYAYVYPLFLEQLEVLEVSKKIKEQVLQILASNTSTTCYPTEKVTLKVIKLFSYKSCHSLVIGPL